MKRTMTMRKWAFWIFVILYPGTMLFTTFAHKNTTDFIISTILAIVAIAAAFVAFYPQKQKTRKDLPTFKKTDGKPMPVFRREVFDKKNVDLLITGVSFNKKDETCFMKFFPKDDDIERVVSISRSNYPYIYDQLIAYDGQDIYPILATIIYSETQNAYYFKYEI